MEKQDLWENVEHFTKLCEDLRDQSGHINFRIVEQPFKWDLGDGLPAPTQEMLACASRIVINQQQMGSHSPPKLIVNKFGFS